MTVYLVGAGPGDPGLLTRRGADLLGRADVVVYDRLVDPALLSLVPAEAVLVDVGKQPAAQGTAQGGTARQGEINDLLVEHGRRVGPAGTVVRLKGGDPFLFGRGGEEAEALQAAGVDWAVVPGVTSAVAVPASAGVPVTHRGLSTSVTVVTGQVGDPTAPGGVDWEALAGVGGTLVVLMGMANRAEIAHRLMAGGRAADTPVAVVEWGTTAAQRTERTTLDRLASVPLGSPAVIVVGPVAALDLAAADSRPLAGTTVVVTRPRDQAGDLVAALGARGAQVIGLPVIEIDGPEDGGAALRRAAAAVAGYDWVAFTSANAVDRFVGLFRDGRDLAGARLAAVGGATAAALRRFGLVADLQPDPAGPATAERLAAAFPAAPPAGGRVLFPRAAVARRSLPDGLSAKGWTVDEVEAYRTVAAAAPPDDVVAALVEARVVTFTSPSTVTGYLSLATAGGHPLPVPPLVACIGPVTAAAARRAGLDVAVESPSPSGEALVGAIVAHLASGGRPASGGGPASGSRGGR
ncbi:MAG TPA: uroporphyrinogen-III C-methyltransferase [Acidimicrobiales bacterium]|nr:uroporphyrinogen-III C-methyltransferase [Acidimicrobiales bacterium]